METDPIPSMFLCPISLQVMENPVIISTGVSYERQSIEKWLFTYKKNTCPATMQPLRNFDLIPNHTLKSLILSWRNQRHLLNSSPSASSSFHGHTELTSLLSAVESSPFKASSLKKLRYFARENPAAFVAFGGIDALRRVILRSASDSDYFSAFQDCEEALGVLDGIPFDDDDASVRLLAAPDSLHPMLLVLQRGCAEARLHAISILQRISRADPSVTDHFHHDIDVFKSLLDLLSDEISASPKLSSSSLDLLLEAVAASKPNRLRAVEAGAVRVLIELLPDAGRHREERVLMLLKQLCECAEGRSAFADHGMGVAAVASKIGRDGEVGTKVGVKVLWLVCSFLPTKKVVEDLMAFGAVKKLLGLVHGEGHSSAREKALRMLRMHGDAWRRFPCFPCELRAVLY